MFVAGFAGLFYYSPQINNSKVETHQLDYYVNGYNLKNVGSFKHKSIFSSATPAISGANATNNTVTMNYTLYIGQNNVTGKRLQVYVNGDLENESLLINSTELNRNITEVPIYSKSGNYIEQ